MAEAMKGTIEMPEGDIKLGTRGLNMHYDSFRALSDVSVSIAARRITALIGPSGCGKSSFLRCFNRMNDLIPSARVEGEVMVDGRDVYGRDEYGREVDVPELRTRVGMVFQSANPFPMSIYDNVAYGPRLHGAQERSALDEIVERSLRGAALWEEVKDTLRKSALDLSGGQQQRLSIARVLAVEPEVLLMDEPCSALDPTATFKIEELMIELMEKYTIVIVTHNMYQASRVSQYTGFFLLGELIEYGPTVEIFENPKDQRTDDYVRGRFG